jgi:hypothetical protein
VDVSVGDREGRGVSDGDVRVAGAAGGGVSVAVWVTTTESATLQPASSMITENDKLTKFLIILRPPDIPIGFPSRSLYSDANGVAAQRIKG